MLIDESYVALIRREGANAYPEECCGFLLGAFDGDDGVRVTWVVPVANQRQGERRRRYLIPPEAFLEAETEAAEAGLAVVGFYHSHPDHPSVPSEFDREHAWPWYRYVIVPVSSGQAGRPQSWRLDPDRARFIEEEIITTHAAQDVASGDLQETARE